MNEEKGNDNKSFEYETNNLIRSNFNEKESVKDIEILTIFVNILIAIQ